MQYHSSTAFQGLRDRKSQAPRYEVRCLCKGVLDRTVVNLQLDSLGIGSDVLEKLRELIQLPNGILLVTGPTGSGKTTTLYSALSEINKVEDKILTAEDPVAPRRGLRSTYGYPRTLCCRWRGNLLRLGRRRW